MKVNFFSALTPVYFSPISISTILTNGPAKRVLSDNIGYEIGVEIPTDLMEVFMSFLAGSIFRSLDFINYSGFTHNPSVTSFLH